MLELDVKLEIVGALKEPNSDNSLCRRMTCKIINVGDIYY
jgi:hypothetical protein